MKNVLSLFVAFVAVTVAALAQNPVLHTLPGDPGATLIGIVPVETDVTFDYFGKKGGIRVANELMVWRTSTNGTEYVLRTPTIAPTSGPEIDFVPTKDLFRQLSASAVAEGARLGFMPPAGTHATKVWFESNVERVGSGVATRFSPCMTWEPVSRNYSVSFTNGIATVTDLTTTNFPNGCMAPTGSVQ